MPALELLHTGRNVLACQGSSSGRETRDLLSPFPHHHLPLGPPLLSPEAPHHCSYLCSTVPVPRCTARGDGVGCNHESLMSSSDCQTLTSATAHHRCFHHQNGQKWRCGMRATAPSSTSHSAASFVDADSRKSGSFCPRRLDCCRSFVLKGLTPEWCLSPVISPRLFYSSPLSITTRWRPSLLIC